MNWLCKLGFHKWKSHYVYVNKDLWWHGLFGSWEFVSDRCQRCGKEVFQDNEHGEFDDYD